MLERRALGMAVRASSGKVEVIQHAALVNERWSDRFRQLGQKPRHGMPPGFLALLQVQCLNRKLCRLLGRKARPLVSVIGLRRRCLLKITKSLIEPVSRSIAHPISISQQPGSSPQAAAMAKERAALED